VVVAVAVATAGAGVSVLVSGVGARDVGGCFPVTTTERVIVSCYGDGGTVTVPASTAVTVSLTGASGGPAGPAPGGRAGRVQAVWTPPENTVLRVELGAQGSPGALFEGIPLGGEGGEASLIAKQGAPLAWDHTTLPANWLWVAGGGGGAGLAGPGAAGGHGGSPDGGPDSPAEGAATGATQSAPGRGGGIVGQDGTGNRGGAGLLGGGGGGDGYYGGGGAALGGGGGGGSSNAAVGAVSYGVAGEPGDGTATISWSLAPAPQPPKIISAAQAAFVVGERDTFTISATGTPTPQLTVGALPPGLSFSDHGDGSGVISGVPSVSSDGVIVVDVTATNGVGPAVTQQLQLRITEPDGARPSSSPPPPSTPDPTPTETNSAAQQDPQGGPGSEPEPEPELVPVAEETVVVAPVSGTVLIRRPDGAVSELKAGEEIPVGSVVDARDGVVRLTSARDANGELQTADFWNAIFRVTQKADPAPGAGARTAAASNALLTELTLRQKPTGCAKARRRGAHAAAAKKKGGLWGDGKGRFRVRGESSSATVRGTKWYVENRCGGTYTRVVRGIVAVRDFTRKKTILLRAGESYTAARRRGA
jgi:hypothetical protein